MASAAGGGGAAAGGGGGEQLYSSTGVPLTPEQLLDPMIQPYNSSGRPVITRLQRNSPVFQTRAPNLTVSEENAEAVPVENLFSTETTDFSEEGQRLIKKYRYRVPKQYVLDKFGKPQTMPQMLWPGVVGGSLLLDASEFNQLYQLLSQYIDALSKFYSKSIKRAGMTKEQYHAYVAARTPLADILPEKAAEFSTRYPDAVQYFVNASRQIPILGKMSLGNPDTLGNQFILSRILRTLRVDSERLTLERQRAAGSTRNIISAINQRVAERAALSLHAPSPGAALSPAASGASAASAYSPAPLPEGSPFPNNLNAIELVEGHNVNVPNIARPVPLVRPTIVRPPIVRQTSAPFAVGGRRRQNRVSASRRRGGKRSAATKTRRS